MAKCSWWIRLNSGWDESSWLESIPWASRAVWPVLLCHVKVSGKSGQCPLPSWHRFAKGHDIPVEAVVEMIEAGIAAGALVIEGGYLIVVNWGEYQSAESSERVARHRAKQKDEPVTPDDVTLRNVTDQGVTLPCHATTTATTTSTGTGILLGGASPPDPPSDPKKSQKPEKIIPPGVVDVLETLQRVAGRKFTPHGSQAGFVRARLKEGATVAEMALVIEHRAALWMNDPRMRDYLRPQTLFCAKHWEDYLPLAVQWANAGRLSPPNSGAKFVAVKDAASNLLEAMRSGT